MAWSRIVGGLVLLLVLSYLLQMLFPRTRSRRGAPRRYLMWDVAPLVGFLGIVLLVLSLVEAIRQEILVAWGGGSALGLIGGLSMWIALTHMAGSPFAPSVSSPPRKRRSFLGGIWHHVRTFGPPLLVGLVTVNIVIRIVGPGVEIFLAAALGVAIVAVAVIVFASASRLGSP